MFIPIVLTLETAEEAMAMLAFLNCPLIQIEDFIKKHATGTDMVKIYKADAGYEIWVKLSDELKEQGYYHYDRGEDG
jgi:hypothetical protein